MAEVEEGLIDRLRESKRREQLELAAGEVCAWLKRNDLPRDNSTAELTAAHETASKNGFRQFRAVFPS